MLVSNEVGSYIKPGVDSIDQQIMFAEKSWGSYRVLDVGADSLTEMVTLNPGHGMNCHSHGRRNEVWTVVSGTGTVVVDGVSRSVSVGDVIDLPIGCKHTVTASESGLQIIEVQMSREMSVGDKIKYII
jgi:mannose-1-phosphate guanylyltransferase